MGKRLRCFYAFAKSQNDRQLQLDLLSQFTDEIVQHSFFDIFLFSGGDFFAKFTKHLSLFPAYNI